MSNDIQQALRERAARLNAKRREGSSSQPNSQQSSTLSNIDVDEVPNTNPSPLSDHSNQQQKQQLINEIKQDIHELQERISALDRERNIAFNDLKRKEETLRQLTTNQSQIEREMTSEELESIDRECAMYLQRQMDMDENQPSPNQEEHQQNTSTNPVNSNFTFSYSSSNVPPHINSLFMNNLGNFDPSHNDFIFGSPSHFPSMIERRRRTRGTNHIGFSPIHQLMNFGLEQRFPFGNIDGMDHDQLLRLQEMMGHVPRGANEEQIESLPTSTFQSGPSQSENTDEKSETDDSENQKCAICLEQFSNGDEVRTLPCFHIFHKHEIDQWLVRNRVCPICRRAIDEQSSSQTDVSN